MKKSRIRIKRKREKEKEIKEDKEKEENMKRRIIQSFTQVQSINYQSHTHFP